MLRLQGGTHSQERTIWHVAAIAHLKATRHRPFLVIAQQRCTSQRFIQDSCYYSAMNNAWETLVFLSRLKIGHNAFLLDAKYQVKSIEIALSTDKTTLIIGGIV